MPVNYSETNHSNDDSKLIDKISIVLVFTGAPFFFIFQLLDQTYLSYMVIPVVLGFLISFFVNRLGYRNLAILMLVSFGSLAAVFFSSVLGKDAGVQNVLIAFLAVCTTTLPARKKWFLFPATLIPVISMTLLDIFNYRFFQRITINPTYLKLVYFAIIISTSVIIVSCIRFYFLESYKAKRKLQNSNESLQDSLLKLKQAYLDFNTAYNELKESKAMQFEMANQVAYAEMVRGIAHEIKNPLYMIRGSAEIMNENPTDEYKTSKFCTVIINSVDRLIKVMTPMMKYGRPISTLTSTPFQIAPLLEEIRQLSEGSCRKKNLKISVDCPDSLTVFADRESVAQILINLVVNAQQYTPEGGQICITATEATYTDTQSQHQIGVCIAVRDTGQGISKDNLTKIFDPFFSSKTDTNNIGLGLSIVFRYVTENNGKIELDSEVGVGTTFRIYLPIAMLENPVETESISGVYFSDSLF